MNKLDKRTSSRLMCRKIYFNILSTLEDCKAIFREFLLIDDSNSWNDSVEEFLSSEEFEFVVDVGISLGIPFFKTLLV
jgi:hypothetical protein